MPKHNNLKKNVPSASMRFSKRPRNSALLIGYQKECSHLVRQRVSLRSRLKEARRYGAPQETIVGLEQELKENKKAQKALKSLIHNSP